MGTVEEEEGEEDLVTVEEEEGEEDLVIGEDEEEDSEEEVEASGLQRVDSEAAEEAGERQEEEEEGEEEEALEQGRRCWWSHTDMKEFLSAEGRRTRW